MTVSAGTAGYASRRSKTPLLRQRLTTRKEMKFDDGEHINAEINSTGQRWLDLKDDYASHPKTDRGKVLKLRKSSLYMLLRKEST